MNPTHSIKRRNLSAIAALSALAVFAMSLVGGAQAAAHGRPTFRLPSEVKCVDGGALTIHSSTPPHARWRRAIVTVDGHPFTTVDRPGHIVRLTGLPDGEYILTITGLTTNGRRASASHRYHSCAHIGIGEHVPAKGDPGGSGGTPTPPPTPPLPTAPEPGRYTVSNSGPYGYGFSFYVSPDGTKLQDISGTPPLECLPNGKRPVQYMYIPDVPIQADGSFAATRQDTAVIEGSPANVTYTFSGHFLGGSFSGMFREEATYDTGASQSCTTGTFTWTASRNSQGSQALERPEPGAYNIENAGSYGLGFGFYLSPDGSEVQDVSGHPGVSCTPGGHSFGDEVYIASIPITADGSFSATRSEQGVIEGSPATLTFTFSGHFHGHDSYGSARAAGVVREEIIYANGTTYKCDSGGIYWEALRESQPGQAVTPALPGAYGVTNAGSYGYAFSFSVSTDGRHLLDVTGTPPMRCTPGGGSVSHQFYIPEIAIAADGSFRGTATEAGVISGHAATLTYTFSGHLHGYDSGGHARMAGEYRMDATYANGVSYSCSSDEVPWWAASR
jgi:hypothetical protein